MLSFGVWRMIQENLLKVIGIPLYCVCVCCGPNKRQKPLAKKMSSHETPMSCTVTLSFSPYLTSLYSVVFLFYSHVVLTITALTQLKNNKIMPKEQFFVRSFHVLILLQNKCLWIVIMSEKNEQLPAHVLHYHRLSLFIIAKHRKRNHFDITCGTFSRINIENAHKTQ